MKVFLPMLLIVAMLVLTAGCESNPTEKNSGLGSAAPGPTVSWPTNETGLTYGSESDVLWEGLVSEEDLASYYPQLIGVVCDDGITEGYVYYDDLYGGDIPTDPEERVEWVQSGANHKTISVYELDGQTVIGTFTV